MVSAPCRSAKSHQNKSVANELAFANGTFKSHVEALLSKPTRSHLQQLLK
jgi:DNA-binding NarL/FixJ family response regulator